LRLRQHGQRPVAARQGRSHRLLHVHPLQARSGTSPAHHRHLWRDHTEQARRTAGEWRSLIAKGIDPAAIEKANREKEALEAARRVQHSFAAVAEQFIIDKVAQERDSKDTERVMRNVFIAAWAERPISDIGPLDILEIVNRKKRHAPQMARALMVLARRFFNWACDAHVYGLDRSPCDRLSVSRIIGPVPKRNRRLSDEEVFAFWRAAGKIGYPVGAAYKMLLLTGLRLREVADLAWSEIHGDLITIPASRMKAKDATAVEHLVPITAAMQEIIASLPRHRGGKYLFSLSEGARPLSMSGLIKRDLDARMLRTLRALARRRGEDHHAVTLPAWVNHDLRRVIRSGLAALRVPHNVCEAVLAHHQGGVVGTYDTHQYLDERREALTAWAEHVASLANPEPAAPAKVVKLRGRRR
jgi:integrase